MIQSTVQALCCPNTVDKRTQTLTFSICSLNNYYQTPVTLFCDLM